MKFYIMLILIFAGLCNAHYMDTANRNSCNVELSDTTVTIICRYRVNEELSLSVKVVEKSDSSYEEIAAKIKNLFADERFENDAAKQKAVDKAEEYMKQLPDTYEKKIELRNLIYKHKKRDSKATMKKKKAKAAAEAAAKAKEDCETYGYGCLE